MVAAQTGSQRVIHILESLIETVGTDAYSLYMDTTLTLTATEVITRVQTARTIAHQCEVEQINLAVQWALLHPCRQGEDPAGWEDDHGLFSGGAPLAGPGAPLVDESPRPTSAQPSASPWMPPRHCWVTPSS